MKRGTITKIVRNYDSIPPRVFGFIGILNPDGTRDGGFITRGIIESRGLTDADVGVEYMVALDYENQRGQYPRVIRLDPVNGVPIPGMVKPDPMPIYDESGASSGMGITPEEESKIPPFDLAAVEMSVYGIETAITGVELALTDHQLSKVKQLIHQIRQCADVLKEELNVSTGEET